MILDPCSALFQPFLYLRIPFSSHSQWMSCINGHRAGEGGDIIQPCWIKLTTPLFSCGSNVKIWKKTTKKASNRPFLLMHTYDELVVFLWLHFWWLSAYFPTKEICLPELDIDLRNPWKTHSYMPLEMAFFLLQKFCRKIVTD